MGKTVQAVEEIVDLGKSLLTNGKDLQSQGAVSGPMLVSHDLNPFDIDGTQGGVQEGMAEGLVEREASEGKLGHQAQPVEGKITDACLQPKAGRVCEGQGNVQTQGYDLAAGGPLLQGG